MIKRKSILIIGVMLLFVGISFSPATASVTIEKEKISFGILGENGIITRETVLLSNKGIREVSGLLYELSDRIQLANSDQNFIDIVDNFIRDKRVAKFPFLVKLLQITVKSKFGNFGGNNLLAPKSKFGNFGNRQSFIMSYGSTNRLPFITKDKEIKIVKPLAFWRYGGSKLLLKSKTVIVERAPFHVKVLSGRQIGLMRGFAGLYIERDSLLNDKSYTFFIGRAIAVRGFDFSFLNNIQRR